MSTVWKYALTLTDGRHWVDMPLNSRVVHVGMQDRVGMHGRAVCLWVLVPDTAASTVGRRFQIFGTGHPTIGQYVGTTLDGDFVWHVFEV